MKSKPIVISPQSPCYECAERKTGCHDVTVCSRWKDYRDRLAVYHKQRRLNNEVVDYQRQIGERIEDYESKRGRRK